MAGGEEVCPTYVHSNEWRGELTLMDNSFFLSVQKTYHRSASSIVFMIASVLIIPILSILKNGQGISLGMAI